MVWIALGADGVKSSAAKFLSEEDVARRPRGRCSRAGRCHTALCRRTRDCALPSRERCATRSASAAGCAIPDSYAFCWVLGFPYLEIDEDDGSARCPRTIRSPRPAEGQWELIDADPMQMRAQHYDMVLNGYELGSGSIRIHKPEEQRKIFEMLGLTPEQIEDRFGFFVRALEYGAPPHGGMALGIDRIVMLACGGGESARSHRLSEEPGRPRRDDGRAERRARPASGRSGPASRIKISFARLKIASNIGTVSLPVLVFWRLG